MMTIEDGEVMDVKACADEAVREHHRLIRAVGMDIGRKIMEAVEATQGTDRTWVIEYGEIRYID
jgi:imidazoleglycerol phosphate dehydratase HisB